MKEQILINRIEAILFLETEPVEIKVLSKNLKIGEKECLEKLKKIAKKYQDLNLAWELVLNENQVQLAVNSKLSVFVKEYFNKKEKNEQFSPAMLEVLSIILYRGPIGKIGIEKIRGVNSDLILRKLTIRGLIERKEKIKNSEIFIYSPSLKLMKKLGISKLENLPDYDKLSREFELI